MSDKTKIRLILLIGLLGGSIVIGFVTKSLLCSGLYALFGVLYYVCLKYIR